MAHWMVDQQLARHNVVRQIGLVVPEFLALPFVVPGSDLVVTMPSRVADRFAKMIPLRVMPLPVELDPMKSCCFGTRSTYGPCQPVAKANLGGTLQIFRSGFAGSIRTISAFLCCIRSEFRR